MSTGGGRTVLLTRAVEQASGTATRLRNRGYGVVIAPLVHIERLEATVPAEAQALLVTSRNGADALAAATQTRAVPVLAVGEATARSLRAAGFPDVRSADGDAVALAAMALNTLSPVHGPVVHVRGAEIRHSPLEALQKAGFVTKEVVLYRTSPQLTMPEEVRLCDTALVYSPGSARRLGTAYPPDGPSLTVIAISNAALEPLRDASFVAILLAASHPTEDAMFGLLDTLPKNPVAPAAPLG